MASRRLRGIVAAAAAGLLAGAATEEPEVAYHPLTKIKAAKSLFEAIPPGQDAGSILKRRIAADAVQTRHDLMLIGQQVDASERPLMSISIQEIGLVGEVEANPAVYLLAIGKLSLSVPGTAQIALSCEWSYEGSSARISEWAADRAAAFRTEFDRVANAIASKIADALQRDPGSYKCLQ